jgi:hypothetical protein
MKRFAALAAAAAVVASMAVPVFAAGNEDDLKVIKKAVRGDSACEPGQAVKWFKVLVIDHKSGTEVVKITLPISLAKLLANCDKDRHVRMDGADVDITSALKHLEELGPMVLLEIVDVEATVKIWLE